MFTRRIFRLGRFALDQSTESTTLSPSSNFLSNSLIRPAFVPGRSGLRPYTPIRRLHRWDKRWVQGP